MYSWHEFFILCLLLYQFVLGVTGLTLHDSLRWIDTQAFLVVVHHKLRRYIKIILGALALLFISYVCTELVYFKVLLAKCELGESDLCGLKDKLILYWFGVVFIWIDVSHRLRFLFVRVEKELLVLVVAPCEYFTFFRNGEALLIACIDLTDLLGPEIPLDVRRTVFNGDGSRFFFFWFVAVLIELADFYTLSFAKSKLPEVVPAPRVHLSSCVKC